MAFNLKSTTIAACGKSVLSHIPTARKDAKVGSLTLFCFTVDPTGEGEDIPRLTPGCLTLRYHLTAYDTLLGLAATFVRTSRTCPNQRHGQVSRRRPFEGPDPGLYGSRRGEIVVHILACDGIRSGVSNLHVGYQLLAAAASRSQQAQENLKRSKNSHQTTIKSSKILTFTVPTSPGSASASPSPSLRRIPTAHVEQHHQAP